MTAFELPTSLRPAECLAYEEAALDMVDDGEVPALLWFWESAAPWVVVGYGQSIAREVEVETCRAEGIPILRRCSGGGTVVQGPGCLNYGLALGTAISAELESITATNRWIMERQRRALAAILTGPVTVEGHTDLALGGRKFSGNAQRRKRHAVLFHGTILRGFDLALITRWLRFPSAQPAYRADRPHGEFVVNTGLTAGAVRDALMAEWGASGKEAIPEGLLPRIPRLLEARYDRPDWHSSR